MKQQLLTIPVLPLATVQPGWKPADVLVRLWTEAEQAVVLQRPPVPAVRQTAAVQRTASIRYAFD